MESMLVKNGPEAKYGENELTRLRLALDAYQLESARLARFPDKRSGHLIFFGLVGESSEVVETLLLHPWQRLNTIQELGDVLWYIAAICDELGVHMSALDTNHRMATSDLPLALAFGCKIVIHAGRIAEHMKKAIRDDYGALTENRQKSIVEELGKILAFVDSMADSMGISLEYVMNENLNKLRAISQANGYAVVYVMGLGNTPDAAEIQRLNDGLPPITFQLQGCPCGSCVTCACSASPAVDQDGLCVGCGGVPLAIALHDGGTPHPGVELEEEDRAKAEAIISKHLDSGRHCGAVVEGGQ
jgi:NTP pyrophosphatase (non-canonical NTP hydrolase)